MREQMVTLGPIAAVAGVLGVCCGLPLLLSIGVVGAIAGWSLQSWALIGLGIVMAGAGGTRFVRARRRGRTCERAGDPDRVDAVAHPTVDGTDATDEAGMEHR